MKTIIAGGRNYVITPSDIAFLDKLRITEVVSGGCRGVDKFGEKYAEARVLPAKVFRADWKKHGKAAGPIRNRQMAEYAEAVVLFTGGRGTSSMFSEAQKAGILIYDLRRQ